MKTFLFLILALVSNAANAQNAEANNGFSDGQKTEITKATLENGFG